MLIRVDPADERPLYRQVADEVKALIAAGKLQAGDPLPAVRQVALDLGVNLNTVASAYRELQVEGFVTVRHGARAVVTARTMKEPAQRELRKTIRTALTELVLAGLPSERIMSLVGDELRHLTKGTK